MSRSPELDEQRKEATRQRILETALHVFAERSIDAVSITDIAREAGLGSATVYRLFDKKPDLVLAVSAWAWKQYTNKAVRNREHTELNAAAVLLYYLDSFIDQYRNNRDLLRFNQFFNVYVKREGIPPEAMKPFKDVIEYVADRFHQNYLRGMKDGTLRTDIPEEKMFSATLHLMLAAVTRYAGGLVYEIGVDPEEELELLKKMLMREYTIGYDS